MIINFINVWNEFFMPFMLITTERMAPVPIGLMNFMSARGIEWGLLGAVMVVTSIPTVVLFLFLSERIQNAMTVGAMLK
jgi:raffinose/stachyose/melibiose transport system permease protein